MIDRTKHNGEPAYYVGLDDISKDTGDFIGNHEPASMKSTTFLFDERHLLYGRLRPYLNKALVPEFSGHCSSEIFPLRPSKKLDRRYLFHWMTSEPIRKRIDATSTGARMPRANMNEVMRFEILLPPLDEQRRIVAVLNEAFESLDRARAHAETSLIDLDYLHQSTLRRAFSGELTGNSAKIGWRTESIAEISITFTDGDWIESKDQSNSGIRLVQTGNIGNGVFKDRHDKARYIDEETFTRLNCIEVLPNDCLISRLPDPVGRSCIVPNIGQKMITAVDCTIFRPNKSKIIPQFLVYFTQSKQYLQDVNQRCTGATRSRISRSNLGKIFIPLPSLQEQLTIVEILDKIFESLAGVQARAIQNLADITELRQSILQRAFAGELT